MTHAEICAATAHFIAELIALSCKEEIGLFLRPDNIVVGKKGITLRSTAPPPKTAGPFLGFSAPEVYHGRQGEASQVYFVGALMYLLLTGQRAPDASERGEGALLCAQSPIAGVINAATQPEEKKRISSLAQLYNSLSKTLRTYKSLPPQSTQANVKVAARVQAHPPKAPTTTGHPPADERSGKASQPFQGHPPQAESSAPAFSLKKETGLANIPPKPAQAALPIISAGTTFPQELQAVKPTTVKIGRPKKGKKSRRFKLALGAAALLLALLCFLGGYGLWQGAIAVQAFTAGNYAAVVAALGSAPWVQKAHWEIYAYSKALLLQEAGRVQESLALLEGISGFSNSAQLAAEMRYNQALGLLQAGSLQEARAIFQLLQTYKSSADYVSKIDLYQQAAAQQQPLLRYRAFTAIAGFLNSASLAHSAGESIYQSAIQQYTSGEYMAAQRQFAQIPTHEKAAAYIQACAMAGSYSQENMAALAALEAQEGIQIGPVLMGDEYIRHFLNGRWYSPLGGGQFEYSYAGRAFYFSKFQVEGDYTFIAGQLVPVNGGSAAIFTYVSFTQLSIAWGDEGPYVFTRETQNI